MIIKSIVRGKIDRRFTLLRKERDRLGNISKRDILLFKVNGNLLIRKILEDFIVSLPRSLPLETNSEINIEIITHIKPEEGLERPKEPMSNGLVDLNHFIPLKTIHGKDIFVIDDEDQIFVWFPVGGGVKHIHINKFVDQEMLFETIGFLWGDGSTENVRSIRFTNSEPSTLLNAVNLFEGIGIDRKTWKVQVIWSGPKEPSEEIKEKCKNFWVDKLNLPKENIKSVLWSKGKSNKTINGSARIFIDNAVLFEIFVNGILKWCKEEIDKQDLNTPTLRWLLRGIMAAEATPCLFNDSLRRVEFSFDPHSNELDFFTEILTRLGITHSKPEFGRHNRFNVDGWKNFFRLFMIDAFKLHKKKNRAFVRGFINHRSTISRLKELELLTKSSLRKIDIARKINIARGSVGEMIKKLEHENLVNVVNNKISLTKFGKEFLSHIL